MSATLQSGSLQSFEPRFVNGEFRQAFQFRASVRIGKGAIPQITQSVFAQFQRTLEMNKIEHFAWPPSRVELTPHADFMGFECELGTLAREPGQTVIHKLN